MATNCQDVLILMKNQGLTGLPVLEENGLVDDKILVHFKSHRFFV